MIFYGTIAITFILALLLEGSVLSFFIVERALPDLLLVMIILWGFLLGERRGGLLGLCAGLLQDIFYGSGLGYFALAKMLLGYGSGLLRREFYQEQLLTPVLMVFVGTLLHELLLNILVGQFVGLRAPLQWTVSQFLIPKAVYNAGLALLLYPLLFRFYQRGNLFGLKFNLREERF